MDVGTFEIVIAGALGLLAAAALVSALGVLLAASLAVAMPALAGLAMPLRRRRLRDWHPPTDWLPADGDGRAGVAGSGDAGGRPIRAVTLVSSLDEDARVQVIAAQVPSAEHGRRPAYVPVTLVHARLEPGSWITLPPDRGCAVLVYVLAGLGFVGGSHRHPVCSGQLAVLEADAPVIAASGGGRAAPGLEVLALGELPAHHPVARGEAVVRRRATQVDRRLHRLRVAEPGATPRRVRHRRPSVPPPRRAAPVDARPVRPGATRGSVARDP